MWGMNLVKRINSIIIIKPVDLGFPLLVIYPKKENKDVCYI